jgi:hypothetical protein
MKEQLENAQANQEESIKELKDHILNSWEMLQEGIKNTHELVLKTPPKFDEDGSLNIDDADSVSILAQQSEDSFLMSWEDQVPDARKAEVATALLNDGKIEILKFLNRFNTLPNLDQDTLRKINEAFMEK